MYPKQKYGRGGGSITVTDEKMDKLYGHPDWADTPFPVAEPAIIEVKLKKRVPKEETVEAT